MCASAPACCHHSGASDASTLAAFLTIRVYASAIYTSKQWHIFYDFNGTWTKCGWFMDANRCWQENQIDATIVFRRLVCLLKSTNKRKKIIERPNDCISPQRKYSIVLCSRFSMSKYILIMAHIFLSFYSFQRIALCHRTHPEFNAHKDKKLQI